MIGVKFFSHIWQQVEIFYLSVGGSDIIGYGNIYFIGMNHFVLVLRFSDELGGNIFPVTILSTATTDANLILPADTNYLGNPKSCIAVSCEKVLIPIAS